MVKLENFIGKMLEETVNACFRPVVFAEGFVVRKDADAFALGFRQPPRVLVGGQRPFGPKAR